MKLHTDKHHYEAPQYEVEDKVWLGTDNLRLTHVSCKLTERWLGLYKVTELVSMNAIHLYLPNSIWIHDVLNISQIKSYEERLLGQSVVAPGLVKVTKDWDDLYEVDYIIDSRDKR